jgi:hypothetical protein
MKPVKSLSNRASNADILSQFDNDYEEVLLELVHRVELSYSEGRIKKVILACDKFWKDLLKLHPSELDIAHKDNFATYLYLASNKSVEVLVALTGLGLRVRKEANPIVEQKH